MSQLPLGLGLGIGLWGTGMSASLLSGGFKEKETPIGTIFIESPLIQDIKTKHKELPCVKDLFKNVDWTKPLATGTNKSLSEKGVKGCIAVWWEKDTYDNGNWRGSWNLLWGMNDGKYGTIFLSDVETSRGEVIGTNVLYFLENKDNKWSLVAEARTEKVKTQRESSNAIMMPDKTLFNPENGWNFDFYSNKVCSSRNKCESESPKREFANLSWEFVEGIAPGRTTATPVWWWFTNQREVKYFGNTLEAYYLPKVKGYFKLNNLQ